MPELRLELRLELELEPRLVLEPELRLVPEPRLVLRLELRLVPEPEPESVPEPEPPSSPGLGPVPLSLPVLVLGSAPPLALARQLRPALAPARPQLLRKQPERCWAAPL